MMIHWFITRQLCWTWKFRLLHPMLVEDPQLLNAAACLQP